VRTARKILVVDDEAAVRALAGACIHHALGDDYEVIYAASGPEALEAAEQHRPDLVLLDIIMPEMDGFEVCRQLRSSSVTSDTPIIFLTAKGEEDSVDTGVALGADGYMVKPFNAVTLAAQITEMLAGSEDR
jgi:CheY-like chemotaxis protein